MIRRLPIPFSYILATGVVLGFVIGFKSLIPYLYWGETQEYDWLRHALPHIINYLFWPFLVPLVHWSFERFPVAKGTTADRLMLAGFSLLIAFTHEIVTSIIYFLVLDLGGWYSWTEVDFQVIKAAFPSVYIGRIVEFWIIYGLFASFDYYKKYKDNQAELGRIEAQLNRTKLAVLKMQLQPHFLFNALNSISSLMEIDVKKAQLLVARLADLLRGILEKDERIFITLDEELEYVKAYLEIEKIRFDERLQVVFKIEEGCSQIKVPALLIQPLAENAIKHGIGKTSKTVTLTIGAKKVGERLQITVSDNGLGQEDSTKAFLNRGIGLRNVQQRLQQLFADQHKLDIETEKGKGFHLTIIIPNIHHHEKNKSHHS